MTRAKTQSTPSINKAAKLEIRNSKQFQMFKNRKAPNQPVSDFVARALWRDKFF
jgi:hypothetical protein